MFVAIVLSLLAFASAENPPPKNTLHDTGNVIWKDCGGDDAWLHVRNFDVSPSPLNIPGPATLTVIGSNGGTAFDQNVGLKVDIKKRLLSIWTQVPCSHGGEGRDLGTCSYDDPCNFMSQLFPNGQCPQEFLDHGLGCTCPFTIEPNAHLMVSHDLFNVSQPLPAYSWLTEGEYFIKMVMKEKGSDMVRFCLEFYINMKRVFV